VERVRQSSVALGLTASPKDEALCKHALAFLASERASRDPRSIGPSGQRIAHFGSIFSTASRANSVPTSATLRFSLKWFPRGSARYGVDRLHHRLAGDKVLLLQAGQPYEIEFLDRRGTESFCLFFSEALLREALAAGEIEDDGRDRLQYVDMVFTLSDGLISVLTLLRSRAPTLDKNQGRAEEILLSLLAELTLIRLDHQRLAAAIPARRPGTRRRLLGSVQRAKEMIDDRAGRPPPLEELARAAGLSKFHLLRTFKAAFNASPMEYAERTGRGPRASSDDSQLRLGRRALSRALTKVEVQDEESKARRQATLVFEVDRRHQLCQAHVTTFRDLLESLPKTALQTDGSLSATNHDGALDDHRLHYSPGKVRCRCRGVGRG
jgi:AraC-like DNA-binding protein